MLGESTKKFPKDATPTAAIQLLCFGMLFAVWPRVRNWEARHQQQGDPGTDRPRSIRHVREHPLDSKLYLFG